MKVTTFVVSSSFFLALWLGVTFIRPVPIDTYPVQNPLGQTASSETQPSAPVSDKGSDSEQSLASLSE